MERVKKALLIGPYFFGGQVQRLLSSRTCFFGKCTSLLSWEHGVFLKVLQRLHSTRAMSESVSFTERCGLSCKHRCAGDRSLQFLILNEEFLVSASHQPVLIISLTFVHTARRYCRVNGLVRFLDWRRYSGSRALAAGKLVKLDHLEEVKVVTRFP